jgi:hypothetical protein
MRSLAHLIQKNLILCHKAASNKSDINWGSVLHKIVEVSKREIEIEQEKKENKERKEKK